MSDKFEAEVKKAFSSVHKDIQNMKDLFDKLNKKVDIIGEQVDMIKTAIQSSNGVEDVPPVPPEGLDDKESGLYGPR